MSGRLGSLPAVIAHALHGPLRSYVRVCRVPSRMISTGTSLLISMRGGWRLRSPESLMG